MQKTRTEYWQPEQSMIFRSETLKSVAGVTQTTAPEPFTSAKSNFRQRRAKNHCEKPLYLVQCLFAAGISLSQPNKQAPLWISHPPFKQYS
ncbi:hypothetical protein DET65_2265 [Sunxiuqinia elliptica]|uniref:Uncharacterized protein n=1 Tax=Sunxiuqinia elliptica TaxID=655355 RepID=A0A4R6GUM4_9BACT|nr:hypothetical protein DET52_108142 [Sunxiuqinia elliptica]TDO60460.1 hypothetical protein DET65_2265 [Sunxiuqinia elliptica]